MPLTPDDPEQINLRSVVGGLAALSTVLLLLVALFCLLTGSISAAAAAFLFFLTSAALTAWLLEAGNEWRRLDAVARLDADAATRAEAAEQEARHARQVLAARVSRRHDLISVWKAPCSEFSCDRAFDSAPTCRVPLEEAKETPLSPADIRLLDHVFRQDPRLNWMVDLAHCEARADQMAEIAAERGFNLGKIWAYPQDLDHGSRVSGFEGRVTTNLNEAGTESACWNYHVGVIGVRRCSGEQLVFDPAFFPEPVSRETWCARLSSGKDPILFRVTGRFVYEDPFDTNGRLLRELNVRRRDAALLDSFDLELPSTQEGLDSTLRGCFVDEMLQAEPSAFEDFQRYWSIPAFRDWWLQSPNYDEVDEILEHDHLFGLPMSEILEALEGVSPELRNFTIRKSFWREIGTAIRDS